MDELFGGEKQAVPGGVFFATVASRDANGIALILPGQTEATKKRYKYNKSVTFNKGDRVKVLSYSGTYVVEYKI